MKLKQALKVNIYDEPVREVISEDEIHIMKVENQFFLEHLKDVLPQSQGFILKVRNNTIKNIQVGRHGLDGLSGVLKASDYESGQIFVVFSSKWQDGQDNDVSELLRYYSSNDSIIEIEPDELEQKVSEVSQIAQAISILNHLEVSQALIKPEKVQELNALLPNEANHLDVFVEKELENKAALESKEEPQNNGLTPEVLAELDQRLSDVKTAVNKMLDEKLSAALAAINPGSTTEVEEKNADEPKETQKLQLEEKVEEPNQGNTFNPMDTYDKAAKIVKVAEGIMGMYTGVGEEFMIFAGSKFKGKLTKELQAYVSGDVFVHEKTFASYLEAKQVLGINE